jgi:hypothetical protein
VNGRNCQGRRAISNSRSNNSIQSGCRHVPPFQATPTLSATELGWWRRVVDRTLRMGRATTSTVQPMKCIGAMHDRRTTLFSITEGTGDDDVAESEPRVHVTDKQYRGSRPFAL